MNIRAALGAATSAPAIVFETGDAVGVEIETPVATAGLAAPAGAAGSAGVSSLGGAA